MLQAWKDLAKLPRENWVLFLSLLINRMGTMAMPFLALYLTESRGFSAATAGTVVGAYGFAGLFATPLCGWLADRWGAVFLIWGSLWGTTLVLILFPLVPQLGGMLLLTLLWAVATEGCRPALMAATTRFAPASLRKTAFAANRLAVNLGMSVGPLVGGFLAKHSFKTLFWVDATTTAFAGALAYFLLPQSRKRISVTSPSLPRAFKAAVTDRAFFYFLAASIPVQIVFWQHSSTMALHLVKNLHFDERLYGLLFSINTVLIVILEIPLNHATRHWPHRYSLALGSLLFGVGFGALAWADGFVAVAATVIVWTFGEMILFPQASAYVSEAAPPGQQGNYMGLYGTSFSLALIIGPWLGTWLMERANYQVLWAAMLGFGSLSALLLWRVPEPGLSANTASR